MQSFNDFVTKNLKLKSILLILSIYTHLRTHYQQKIKAHLRNICEWIEPLSTFLALLTTFYVFFNIPATHSVCCKEQILQWT